MEVLKQSKTIKIYLYFNQVKDKNNDFNEWLFTVHVPIHVNIRDPILCTHLGTCYVLKLA